MVTKVRGSSQLRVANYTELRLLDSSKLTDGQTIQVTNDGIAGQFVVKTGTVTDNGGTRIVFTDDSNRYWGRDYVGPVYVEWFEAAIDNSTDDSSIFQTVCDEFDHVAAGPGIAYCASEITLTGTNKRFLFECGFRFGSNTTDAAVFKLGSTTTQLLQSELFIGGNIDGQDRTTSRIAIKECWAILNKITVIGKIFDCGSGVQFRQENNNTVQIHNTHYLGELRENIKGIWFRDADGGVVTSISQTEGHHFYGNQIVGSNTTHGVLYDSSQRSGGCFFHFGAIDCSAGVNYENNMTPANTNGNRLYGYLPNGPAGFLNKFAAGDTFENMPDDGLVIGGKVEVSGNTAFNPFFIKPWQGGGTGTSFPSDPDDGTHNYGIRVSGDSIRYKGGQIIVYGGTHATYPGETHLLTPTVGGGAERIRIEIEGNANLVNGRLRDTIWYTDDCDGNAFQGTSAEDGVVIHGSSDTGLPSNISIQRGDSANMYLSKPSGFTGSTYVTFRVGGTGEIGSIAESGGNIAYNTTSDYRVKTVVEKENDALSRVLSVKLDHFYYNHDKEKTVHLGGMAHEIAKCFPNSVTGEKDAIDENGDPILQQVDWSKVVPDLISAIQEIAKRLPLSD